jgi:hypothetical protein
MNYLSMNSSYGSFNFSSFYRQHEIAILAILFVICMAALIRIMIMIVPTKNLIKIGFLVTLSIIMLGMDPSSFPYLIPIWLYVWIIV